MKDRWRIAGGLLTLGLIAGVLVFSRRWESHELVDREAGQAPVTSPSFAKPSKEGPPRITLEPVVQQRLDLETGTLPAAELELTVAAYGQVLDPAPLLSLVTEIMVAQVEAVASAKEFERTKVLYEQAHGGTLRGVEIAEAAARRDQLQVESLRLRLASTWGAALASRSNLVEFASSLGAQAAGLVRLELLAGQWLAEPPVGATVVALAEPSHSVPVILLGRATLAAAQGQAQGWLFLVETNRLHWAAGTELRGELQLAGEGRKGVVVPDTAVVRVDGQAWVYRECSSNQWTRQVIGLDHPMAAGWLVTQYLTPGTRVIVRGAQAVLSEERKQQIRMLE